MPWIPLEQVPSEMEAPSLDNSAPQAGETVALIAGNGAFPRLFARAARDRGVRVVALALVGETDPTLAAEVDGLVWLRVGQLGRMQRQVARWRAPFVAMAGGVDKKRLFSRARPDWLGMRVLMASALRRDDSLLRAVAHVFEQTGAKVIDSTIFLPEALVPKGVVCGLPPAQSITRDLGYGLEIARTIGKLDIGQTVVVRDGAVVALEAIEGTDACILRAGLLTHGRGATVVKVAKPEQDMRFDVPAVGPRTLESLKKAGVKTLGLEAGRVLLLEPSKTLELARRYQISIVGLC